MSEVKGKRPTRDDKHLSQRTPLLADELNQRQTFKKTHSNKESPLER